MEIYRSPEEQRAALALAKTSFSRNMLESGTFAQLISDELTLLQSPNLQTSNFEFEPMHVTTSDGSVAWGIMIRTFDDDPTNAFQGNFAHFELCSFNTDTDEARLSEEFAGWLEATNSSTADTFNVIETWGTSWDMLTEEVNGIANIDPGTGTVKILEDIHSD